MKLRNRSGSVLFEKPRDWPAKLWEQFEAASQSTLVLVQFVNFPQWYGAKLTRANAKQFCVQWLAGWEPYWLRKSVPPHTGTKTVLEGSATRDSQAQAKALLVAPRPDKGLVHRTGTKGVVTERVR